MVRLMCVHIIFSSVWPWVAEWPPFGERLTICSLCSFLFFVILVISRFCFEGLIWVLLASVPDICIFFLHLPIFCGCTARFVSVWSETPN